MKIKVTNPTDTPRAFITSAGIVKVRTGETKALDGVQITAASRKALEEDGVAIETITAKTAASKD